MRSKSQKMESALGLEREGGDMKKRPRTQRWGILLPLLMLVASHAFGSLGETPQQMENRRSDKVIASGGGYTLIWNGKRMTHAGFFLGGRAVIEAFRYNDRHPMTSQELEQLLKPYAWCRRGPTAINDNETVHAFDLIRPNGRFYGIVTYDKTIHTLMVFQREAFDALYAKELPAQRIYDSLTAERIQPPAPPPPPATQEKNDCMLVATENLKRLVAANVWWSDIIGFQITEDGTLLNTGHAVAVWKLSNDGHVYAIDGSGTVELDTTSTNVEDILLALGIKYSQAAHKQVRLVGHFAK
jgi:hypothetical protein